MTVITEGRSGFKERVKRTLTCTDIAGNNSMGARHWPSIRGDASKLEHHVRGNHRGHSSRVAAWRIGANRIDAVQAADDHLRVPEQEGWIKSVDIDP